jgi:hypothetical protein
VLSEAPGPIGIACVLANDGANSLQMAVASAAFQFFSSSNTLCEPLIPQSLQSHATISTL